MYARALIIGAIAGAIALFCWGAVSHMVAPWAKTWVAPFPGDATAVTEQLKSLAPASAVYYDPHGYFLAAAPLADGGDKTKLMGSMLGMEFAQNLFVGLILAGLLVAFRTRSLYRQALLCATMGLAAAIDIHMSQFTWYGFAWHFTLPAMIDIVVGWFLAGIAIGWVLKKWGPKEGAMPA
jgi:hypothetical protein